MRKLSTLFLLLITLTVCAQTNISATDSLVIKGDIKKEMTFTMADLEKYQPKKIDDILSANYREKSGSTARELNGILLKDLLTATTFNTKTPKDLSEFNLTFLSADGSKLVYSWRELLDSAIGDKAFIITSIDGQKTSNMKEGILFLTASESKTGSGYLTNLNEIDIQKVK